MEAANMNKENIISRSDFKAIIHKYQQKIKEIIC